VIYISDEVIEGIIREDVPSLDLTTATLELANQPGTLTCTSRDDVVVCGTEEAVRICARLGVSATGPATGTRLEPGSTVLEATGDVAALHQAWRASLKVLESCSGIATRTARLIDRARSATPDVEVLTTRKHFPGTRDLAIKAVAAGGALPHRLGLSETVLIFEQHWVFCGGLAGLLPRIPQVRHRLPDKKVLVEVNTVDDAWTVAAAGADGIQFDKASPQDLQTWVPRLRAENPGLVLLAAGGIGEHNAAVYAATGVDALVTSWVYFGQPADLRTTITPAPSP
jgi:molybdenum transport protein